MAKRRPRGDGTTMTEAVVSGAVRGLITMAGGEWYSTEVGFLGEWVDGKAVGRRGGTRGTPGWPDLAALMNRPHRYLLTVEVKGTNTTVRKAQWQYALNAMRYGHPHLMVRSAESFVWGLWWLGLMPEHWRGAPLLRDWQLHPPENVAYLPRTRRLYWEQLAVEPPYPLPSLVAIAEADPKREPPYPELLSRPGDWDW